MFGIGFPELIVILIIGLVVLGPNKLPELAKAIAKGLAEFKKATQEIKQNLDLDENIKEIKNNLDGSLKEIKADLDGSLREITKDLDSDIKEIKNDLDGDIKEIKDNLDGDIKEIKNNLDGDIKETENDPAAGESQEVKAAPVLDTKIIDSKDEIVDSVNGFDSPPIKADVKSEDKAGQAPMEAIAELKEREEKEKAGDDGR